MSYDIHITTAAERDLALYTISEGTNRVIIVRFLFQKSNWASILRHGISLE